MHESNERITKTGSQKDRNKPRRGVGINNRATQASVYEQEKANRRYDMVMGKGIVECIGNDG